MKPKKFSEAELLKAVDEGFDRKRNKEQVALLDEMSNPDLTPERLRAIFEQNGDNIRLRVLSHPRCPVDLLDAAREGRKFQGPRSA